MVHSAAVCFAERSSDLLRRLDAPRVPVGEALSLALFVQTWGAYSPVAPSPRMDDGAASRVAPTTLITWHQQWFGCFQDARRAPSGSVLQGPDAEGLALLVLASLQHRPLEGVCVLDTLQSSASCAQYYEAAVRELSEYFLQLVNGSAMLESLVVPSNPIETVPSASITCLDAHVVGYRMVCCLCILWRLLRSVQVGSQESGGPPLPTSFARRRYEKLFNHRSMPMYTRMLTAFLRQEPVVPVRGEEETPLIDHIVENVYNATWGAPSNQELKLLEARLDVVQCFGATSTLAASLLAEFCGLGYGEEVVSIVQRDVVSRRTLEEGFDAAVRVNSRIHAASQLESRQCVTTEMLCVAASTLLQHTAVAIDLASSMCAAAEVTILNDFLSTMDVVCTSVYTNATAERANGVGIVGLRDRLVQTAYWCSSYLTLSNESRGDDVLQWLKDISGAASVASKTRSAVDCDVSGIAETQDSQATQDGRQSTRPSTLHPRAAELQIAPRPGTADKEVHPLRSGAAALKQVAETMAAAAEEQDRLSEIVCQLRQKDISNRRKQDEQDAEISSLKDALAQAKHDLMEESSSNAAHVSQLTMRLRQQQDTITTQDNRIRILERQLKRFEQMSAVIRSMTTELAQPSSFDGEK